MNLHLNSFNLISLAVDSAPSVGGKNLENLIGGHRYFSGHKFSSNFEEMTATSSGIVGTRRDEFEVSKSLKKILI